MIRKALVLMLLCRLLNSTMLHASQEAGVEQTFRSFLQEWEAAQTRFINGDPTLWKQHTSQRPDVTILGGFGGEGEKGWKAVASRYDWASSQYQPGGATLKVDYLNVLVSGDLAITAAIERQQNVRVGTKGERGRRALRATQIFRKEGGAWKLVHRHADQMTEKETPTGGRER